MERFGEVVHVIFKGLNGCILRIGSMVMSLYRNKENRGKGGGGRGDGAGKRRVYTLSSKAG